MPHAMLGYEYELAGVQNSKTELLHLIWKLIYKSSDILVIKKSD